MLKLEVADSPLYKYGLTLVFTVIALALSWVFWPLIDEAPFLFFIGAVVLSAWLGGMGPGMVSAALTIVAADFFLIDPVFTVFTSPSDIFQFGIFSLIAFLIGWLEENRRQSEQEVRDVRDELAVILNTVEDGITAQNEDGQPVFANVSAANLTGYTSTEAMLNTSVKELQRNFMMFDLEDKPLSYDALPRYHVFKHGESSSLTFKMRFSDNGEEKWVNLTSSPVFNKDGSVKMAVNVLRDITDQITAQKSLLHYAAIVQNSSDAIISKSPERLITRWNPGAEQVYGYSAQEAIGQPISILFPEDLKPHERQLIDRINQGEKIQHHQTRRVRKDGQEIHISLTVSPIYSSDGQIQEYSTIERDITETKHLSDQIDQERRKLTTILNAIPGIVYEGSGGGAGNQKMDFISQHAEKMLGYTLEEWNSMPSFWKQVIHPDDWEQAVIRGDETYDKQIPGPVPFRCITKDGRILYTESYNAVITDQRGNRIGTCGLVMDVTDRRKREEEINRLNRALADQHERLNNIVRNVPGIVYEVQRTSDDDEPRVTYLSEYAESMLGYSLDEMMRVPNIFNEVIHPDDREHSRLEAETLYESAQTGSLQYRVITKNDDILYLESHHSIAFDATGNANGTIGVIMDVTERKKREAEIMQLTSLIETQRQRLDSIIRNLPGIIFDANIEDETGKQSFSFISDYTETMLGYPSQNWHDNPNFWETIVEPEDMQASTTEAHNAFVEDRPGNIQFRCHHASGATIYAESFFNFIKTSSGVRQLGVIMDVTERKVIEEALQDYTEDLRRSNEELEQFAYVASHDLQEPLRMVTSYLQLIEKRYTEKLDDDGKEFIEFAVDGATRMKSLINDLLAYSRVQRSKTEFTIVNMPDVIDKVLYNLQITIEDSGATITHDTLPAINGNEGQLTQLFQNLISNALKFHGEETPQIHIGVERLKNKWQFYVRDNGIGIEPEYQDRIFVIFQRLHTRQDYPGTGIGLAICRKIVDKHGGKIWFESEPGEGTTFYFTIPLKQRKRLQHASH